MWSEQVSKTAVAHAHGRGMPFGVKNPCGLHPNRTIPLMGTTLKSAFLWDHTHYGTPFLRPSAYKARVRGVSPRCGILQIREGGIGSSTHSQSEQYLIRERFVPPTGVLIVSQKIIIFTTFRLTFYLQVSQTKKKKKKIFLLAREVSWNMFKISPNS